MRITFLIQSEKTKIFSCILITFLLLAFAPLVEAQNQRVHLTGTDNSLRTAFEQIEKQTKMSVDYDAKILDTSRPAPATSGETTVGDLMKVLLQNSGCTFTIQGSHILISRQVVAENKNKVTGSITDERGEPVIGASVLEKGTTNGTITDLDGKFTLEVSSGAVLSVSFVGYQTLSVNVEGRRNVNITLKEDMEQLEEVVVVGYGTQKKSSLTASVATVPAQELNKQVGHSVASALQGRTPGVEVLQKGGEAGADIKILVRGAGTFGATEPLYVIDGAFSNNGLNSLNPSDIESMEILKDGSAAAIYGSRAANGVVLITTKHGQKGKAKVEISANYSMQTPSKYLDFLDANEHREYTKQLVANSSNQTQAPENVNPTDPGINTDWQDAYLRNSPMYNLNAAISGGGEYSTFNTSIGYFDQQGIMEFSGFKKYNARVNGTFKKGRLTVSETLSAAFTNKEPQVRMVMGIPTVPMTDAEGRYVSAGREFYVNESKVTNPFASYSNTVKKK